ncbi:KTR3 [Symbiodinium pilosum]|uniref:KTR3 protein n=1 Tax=Symbiodinium pilosum TaxID=2952 RepID=A0A812X7X6_SYMPI|nr:KTR3 [Symbiodinium pilosum]
MSEHPSCSPGYRRAARFTAGPLWMHEALNAYSHILLVDTEFVLSHPVPWDPIWYMFEQSADLGYWQTHYEKTWNRTVYLTEVSKQFMQARNLTPQVPELVSYWWDEDEVPGGSLPVNIYGCLFGGSISFFRSDLYQSYFQELDAWPGFDEYCWSPQNILAIAAAFFLNDNIITELWVYGRHQNSSKTPDEGWNDSRRGILPQSQRPAHLQVTGKQ